VSAWSLEASRAPRGLRPFVLAGAVALLGVVIAVGAWRFVSPPDSASALSAVRLAPANDFAPGSVTGYRITSEGEIAAVLSSRAYRDTVTASGGRPTGTALFYVVRLPDGDFRVLSGRSTHLGGAVVWDTTGVPWSNAAYVGVFIEPAHSEQWTIDGTRFYGPAPRDLDRYEWQIDDGGVLVIDLSEVVPGPRGSVAPPLYDVNDPGWPTSGWPSRLD